MKFVIPRGRLMEDSLAFLRNAGITVEINDSRKLIFRQDGNEIILPRARDVPVYTEYAGDIGICGTDTLAESRSNLFAPLSLDFGKCRLSIIAPRKYRLRDLDGLDIATKHPNITSKYFSSICHRSNGLYSSQSVDFPDSKNVSNVQGVWIYFSITFWCRCYYNVLYARYSCGDPYHHHS